MWICQQCGEQIEDQFESCWKCAGNADWIGLPFRVLLKRSRRHIVRGVLLAVGLIAITWIFFGPITAFHHTYAFGVTAYLVLNAEHPQPGDHMWGEYAVKFFPIRFAAGAIFWAASIFILWRVVRFLTKKRDSD